MGPVTTTDPVTRIVIEFTKEGSARFIGHMDLMRTFQRASRRAGVPVAYSQGFNPRPRLSFASPLPLGVTGRCELAAFDLSRSVPAARVAGLLNASLPEGIRVVGAWESTAGKGAFGTRIESDWLARLRLPEGRSETDLPAAVADILAAAELQAVRREGRTADIRALVLDIWPEIGHDFDGREAAIGMKLVQMGDLSAKPQDVVSALAERLGPVELVELERRSVQTENTDMPGGSRPPGRAASGGKEVIQDV